MFEVKLRPKASPENTVSGEAKMGVKLKLNFCYWGQRS